MDNCLKTEIDKQFLLKRRQLFQDLRKSKEFVEIVDFGAGSKKMGKTRKVSQIFQTSSSKGKYGELLYKIAHHYKPKQVLELGTSLGIGTAHLAKGNPSGIVETVEGCPNTFRIANTNLQLFDAGNVITHNSTFDNYLKHYQKFWNLIFIDGHHNGEALLHYIDILYPHLEDDSLVILDDIRWSAGMLAAWNSLQTDSRFHLTIDLFRVGIIAKRHIQAKEHFVIKM